MRPFTDSPSMQGSRLLQELRLNNGCFLQCFCVIVAQFGDLLSLISPFRIFNLDALHPNNQIATRPDTKNNNAGPQMYIDLTLKLDASATSIAFSVTTAFEHYVSKCLRKQ